MEATPSRALVSPILWHQVPLPLLLYAKVDVEELPTYTVSYQAIGGWAAMGSGTVTRVTVPQERNLVLNAS